MEIMFPHTDMTESPICFFQTVQTNNNPQLSNLNFPR